MHLRNEKSDKKLKIIQALCIGEQSRSAGLQNKNKNNKQEITKVTMKEEDLALARALVAESESESPYGSPSPLRKTPITEVKNRAQAFR